MSRNRHFIYDLYLALADTNSLTEPEGRQAIKDLLPHLASAVDPIIESNGDMAVAKEAETQAVSAAISDQLRARYRNMRSASIGPIGATVRQQLRGNRITEGS